MISVTSKPDVNETRAEIIARQVFGLAVRAREFPGERDRNFLLEVDGRPAHVLKAANLQEPRSVLDFQVSALDRLRYHDETLSVPRVRRALNGDSVVRVEGGGLGKEVHMRLVDYLEGEPIAHLRPYSHKFLFSIGSFLAHVDTALMGLSHPAAHRHFQWLLSEANQIIQANLRFIARGSRRALVVHYLRRFESFLFPRIDLLRHGIIHNDGNDYNFLAEVNDGSDITLSGLLDFGDMAYSAYVHDPAVAAAYAMLDTDHPLQAAGAVLAGFHDAFPLEPIEIDTFFDLACLRLCTSVTLAAAQQAAEPNNRYLSISEEPAWRLLDRLAGFDPEMAMDRIRIDAGISSERHYPSAVEIIEKRRSFLGPSLSLSYQKPLHIVRGLGAFLFDADGNRYLDMVNNVAHVGHCHPRVVAAGQQQMTLLNTNTRYLNHLVSDYAERLLALFPDPLEVCYFVCSGSEANELALRMAQAHARRRDIIVLGGAYHGNTTSLIEISPYKYRGQGGLGPPEHVHEVEMPDTYRGSHRGNLAGPAYARDVANTVTRLSREGHTPGAFIAESLLGCGGQIQLPDDYLRHVYRSIRDVGGVCIADEVQTGFGRVGQYFWGYSSQGVIPDIVTLGKPMGNGHPLAAVVTTRKIADSFDNGMEYFNTFGGNPVSCAIGLAVLDVIEEEQLQTNAAEVGEYLKGQLSELQERYDLIGDVRGMGLFLGIEMVADRGTLSPAPAEATRVVDQMKGLGVLLSTDGPFHNVIKIKPPLVLSKSNVDEMVELLDVTLKKIVS